MAYVDFDATLALASISSRLLPDPLPEPLPLPLPPPNANDPERPTLESGLDAIRGVEPGVRVEPDATLPLGVPFCSFTSDIVVLPRGVLPFELFIPM